jgi:hypothetical protein
LAHEAGQQELAAFKHTAARGGFLESEESLTDSEGLQESRQRTGSDDEVHEFAGDIDHFLDAHAIQLVCDPWRLARDLFHLRLCQ